MEKQDGIDAKFRHASPRFKSKHVVVKTKEEQFHEFAMAEKSRDYPRQIYFGWKRPQHLEGAQRSKDNKVRTSRYTETNWIPLALFN